MELLCMFIGIFVGIAIGYYFVKNHYSRNISGYLKRATDDDEQYLFLELKTSPDTIMSKDYVIFKVDKQKIVPHK